MAGVITVVPDGPLPCPHFSFSAFQHFSAPAPCKPHPPGAETGSAEETTSPSCSDKGRVREKRLESSHRATRQKQNPSQLRTETPPNVTAFDAFLSKMPPLFSSLRPKAAINRPAPIPRHPQQRHGTPLGCKDQLPEKSKPSITPNSSYRSGRSHSRIDIRRLASR